MLNSNKAFYEEPENTSTKANSKLSDNFKGSAFIHQITDYMNNVTLSELTKGWLGINDQDTRNPT